jgi:hypothetical protein
MSTDPIRVLRGRSFLAEPAAAVAELREQIDQPDAQVVLVFASPRYDARTLASALRDAFACPVVGCTTAGELSSEGYSTGSLVGVSIAGTAIRVHPVGLRDLEHFGPERAATVATGLRARLSFAEDFAPGRMFGVLLIDGLTMREEMVTAMLYEVFGGIQLAGGSAGDEFQFRRTGVLFDGAFHHDAAVFLLFETYLPFSVFKVQNFRPTDRKLVITESEPRFRLVTEINAGSAVDEYAKAVGVETSAFSPQVFATRPLMLSLGGSYYLRSIQQVNADGSMTFYCAIDDGLVLTVAEEVDVVNELENALDDLREQIQRPSLVLAFDCVLRRHSVFRPGVRERIESLFQGLDMVGFSTYGEQYNAIHINHTLVGVAIGGGVGREAAG